jgi:adenine phosphoribosyltransferase
VDRPDATARERLLEGFRRTKGHADFAVALRDPRLLAALGPALAAPFRTADVSAVIAVEARGFVVGALVARELEVGLVLARKPGAVHPDADHERATTADWRGRRIEILVSRKGIRAGDRLLLVDDWIETGTQARTVSALVERHDAALIGVSVMVDDTTNEVRDELHVVGLVRSSDLPPSEHQPDA